MVDYIAITALIITVLNTIGGSFAYFHIRLNSNCCGCCTLDLYERGKSSSNIKYENKDTIVIEPTA
jgi:hypothetical protein